LKIPKAGLRGDGRSVPIGSRTPAASAKIALRKARPLVLSAAAKHAALARWAGKTPEERRAHSKMMNLARKVKAA